MDMDRYIGRLLDNRYEILEVIGSGGMAVVYKARCHRLNRLVAIKILKDENLQDEDFRRRFHAESQAVAMLSHPNIVSVYDVSATDEADYIVMELIDGITLKQYMERKGVLSWKETLHFAIQIAKALEHAHSRGLVHRDIKPHNVMVLKNGSVKVADFGIAQVMTNPNTLTKEALGSVHYISPEQAKGGRVDHRSDLYSLGVVMYEMIAGRPPFDGETPVSVALQHIQGGAVKPSRFNPNMPAGLEQIILKAMAHDTPLRYPTATAMLYDMDELRKDPNATFAVVVPEDDQQVPLPGPVSGDQSTRVISTAEKVAEKKVAAKKKSRPAPKKPAPTPKTEEPEEDRSRVAVIAIVACSVVAVVAILIFLILMVGGASQQPKQVQIPSLVGQRFDDLPNYNGIVIRWSAEEYSETFEKGKIIRQEPEGGTYHEEGTVVFVVVSLGEAPPASTMVDLVGMSEEKAREYLNGLDIGLYILPREENSATHAAGKITRTTPAEGEPLRKGQTVTIWVSLGPEVVTAPVPNLLAGNGMMMETAQRILNNNGFYNLEWVSVDNVAKAGTVLSQSEVAGSVIDVTTLIVIEYSTGVDPEIPTNPTDPSQPTEPVDPTVPTEPTTGTEPATPTEPSVPGTNKSVVQTFVLPVMEEAYTLRIVMNGRVILNNTQVMPNAGEITLTLTGSGVQQCTLYINGEYYETVTVNFETDE